MIKYHMSLNSFIKEIVCVCHVVHVQESDLSACGFQGQNSCSQAWHWVPFPTKSPFWLIEDILNTSELAEAAWTLHEARQKRRIKTS